MKTLLSKTLGGAACTLGVLAIGVGLAHADEQEHALGTTASIRMCSVGHASPFAPTDLRARLVLSSTARQAFRRTVTVEGARHGGPDGTLTAQPAGSHTLRESGVQPADSHTLREPGVQPAGSHTLRQPGVQPADSHTLARIR
jgi:hypothetical protein